MTSDLELQREVAERLDKAGFSFERQTPIGGVRPDFLVHGPQGQVIILEVKRWTKRPGFTGHAAEQVRLYKEKIGADAALIVLDNLQRSNPAEGVVTLDRMVDALSSLVGKPPEKKRPEKKRVKSRRPKAERVTIFVAMPFAAEYEDAYLGPIAHAAESVGGTVLRVDREDFDGDIMEEIRRQIRACTAIIVDLSESKPNVLYEAGFAHALGKPAVHICSTPLDDLPFDVRNWNTLPYRKGQTHRLKKPLSQRLQAVIEKGSK